MAVKKTIFSVTKLPRSRVIWVHFIYGKYNYGSLVLHLTFFRDAFFIKEEIIGLSLMAQTITASWQRKGQEGHDMQSYLPQTFSLKKPAIALHSKQVIWHTCPSVAWALGKLPGTFSAASLHSLCGDSLGRGHTRGWASWEEGLSGCWRTRPEAKWKLTRGRDGGAGMRPVTHPAVQWAGMRTGTVGHQGARLWKAGSWSRLGRLCICGCILGSPWEFLNFMFSRQWKS